MQPAAPSFSEFFIFGEIAEGSIRYTQFNGFMVVLSYMVAALASYLAMMILMSVLKSRRKAYKIVLGAVSLGTGVWSMHFIGMLASETSMVHEYDVGITMLSWLVAISFSYLLLYNFAYKQITRARIAALTPLLAFGIISMHYVGMSAMRMKAHMQFEVAWFAASIAIALAASCGALIMMRYAIQANLKHSHLMRLGTSLLIAFAICGMHYSGMAGTVFTPFADCRFDQNQSHIELVLLIVACTLIVMGVGTLLVLWSGMHASAEQATRRWPYIYYLLAGFNMLTVGAGLYMSHLSIQAQTASEKSRDTWRDYNISLQKIHLSTAELLSSLVQIRNADGSLQSLQRSLDALIVKVHSFELALAQGQHEGGTDKIARALETEFNQKYKVLLHITGNLKQTTRTAQTLDASAIGHIEEHVVEFSQMLGEASVKIAETLAFIAHKGREENDALMKINAVIYLVLTALVFLTTAGGVKIVRRIRKAQEEKDQYLIKLQESQVGLQESHVFLKKIIDSVADPIFVKNRRHQWIVMNTAFCEMLGYSAEELIGKSDFDIFPNEQASVFWEMDEKIFAGDEIVVNEESITKQNGEERIILTKKVPVLLGDGTTGIVGVFHDITDRILISNELRGHRDNLAQLVNEQTKDVVEAKNRAESANKAKSEFLSNMSHELRTPIHAIKSFAQLSYDLNARDLSEQERHKISRFMQNIMVSADRLNLLVGDLLDMSKLESGKIQYSFEDVNILSLVSHCFDQLHGLMLDKQMRYDIDVATEMHTAQVDNRTVMQVIINLLSNAIKFSPEKSLLHCRISCPDHATIQVALSDEGPGIPENELDTIFDKFVQSSKTKTKAGGTGLGLAICRQIVSDHQGRIWFANNQNGLGVTVYVNLPLKHEEVAA